MKRSLDTGSSGAAASAHAGHSDTTNPYLAHHNSAPKMAKSDGTNPHTGAPYSDRYRRILAGRLTLPVYVVASTPLLLLVLLLLLSRCCCYCCPPRLHYYYCCCPCCCHY